MKSKEDREKEVKKLLWDSGCRLSELQKATDAVIKYLEEYAQQQFAPSWVKASELPTPLPDVVFTFIRGKIFSYNTDYNLKGLQEVIKHHPEGWYMGINYPEQPAAERAAQTDVATDDDWILDGLEKLSKRVEAFAEQEQSDFNRGIYFSHVGDINRVIELVKIYQHQNNEQKH